MNNGPGWQTVNLSLTLTNMSADTTLPHIKSYPAYSRTKAVRLTATGAPYSWSSSMYGLSGKLDAPTTDTYAYNMPWDAGDSYFTNYSPNPTHGYALDFGMPESTPLYAARAGVVIAVIDSYSVGGTDPALPPNIISIEHVDGTIARYLHLVKGGARVQVGQIVNAGDLIGLSGNVGYSSGPHLHFDVLRRIDINSDTSMVLMLRTAETGAFTPPVTGWYTALAAQDNETFSYPPRGLLAARTGLRYRDECCCGAVPVAN